MRRGAAGRFQQSMMYHNKSGSILLAESMFRCAEMNLQ
jgi:hypothetical protein